MARTVHTLTAIRRATLVACRAWPADKRRDGTLIGLPRPQRT
jgi:hypothetical protein